MKTSESIAVATVSLFEAGDPSFLFNPTGAENFHACSLKTLGHSYGYALRAFHEHSSKIFQRRIDEINRS